MVTLQLLHTAQSFASMMSRVPGRDYEICVILECQPRTGADGDDKPQSRVATPIRGYCSRKAATIYISATELELLLS